MAQVLDKTACRQCPFYSLRVDAEIGHCKPVCTRKDCDNIINSPEPGRIPAQYRVVPHSLLPSPDQFLPYERAEEIYEFALRSTAQDAQEVYFWIHSILWTQAPPKGEVS